MPGLPSAASPEPRDVSLGLLDEFGTGDAREREESWRYSKVALRALSQQEFVPAATTLPLSTHLQAQFDWPTTRGRRLVFINGALAASHSDIGALGGDVLLEHGPDNHLVVRFSGESRDQPLHLVYASVADTAPARWHATSRIELRSGRATVIEQHLGDQGAGILGSLVSDVAIAANAQLCLASVSELPDTVALYRRAGIVLADHALLTSTHAAFGGRLQRLDLAVNLAGERARLESNGCFVLRGREHADMHLDVRHGARDTESEVLWRGVADERARGVFRGAITVAAGADGADARLSNKNLLLSAQAEIDTQPVLEIYADEVKAAHGATVGQLDPLALFYLRSRGVPAESARNLLIAGFCRETFAAVGDELRARLEKLLVQRLPQTPLEAR